MAVLSRRTGAPLGSVRREITQITELPDLPLGSSRRADVWPSRSDLRTENRASTEAIGVAPDYRYIAARSFSPVDRCVAQKYCAQPRFSAKKHGNLEKS